LVHRGSPDMCFGSNEVASYLNLSYKNGMGLEDDEGRLAQELQGKRLICEVDVSQEEVSVWQKEVIRPRSSAWNKYPSISAIATVNAGIYEYHHGDFWSAFPELEDPSSQSHWGKRFERYLHKHDSLETFQELKKEGHRYVAPILAHGGVPQYCLEDFFVLLSKYSDPEQPSSEFIDYLGLHQNVMVNIDKPVQRFLLYGGEVAEEFVARCLALCQSREQGDGGGTHGLPKRVIDVFSKWYAERGPTNRQHIRRFPKPEIRMQPGDIWVYLRLPRSDDHPEISPDTCWEVCGKFWAVSRNHEIPLIFSDGWTVRYKGHEVNLQGISNSEPALFFNPASGKSIPNPRLRRLPEHLWAVFSQSASVEPEPSYREGIPTWPGYVIAVFNLEGQRHLKIGDHQFEVRRPFFHIEQDPVVKDVISAEGLPIFHMPPKIEWEGTANLTLSRGSKNEGNIDIASDDLQMWFDEPGEYEFILRGPFGQNVRKRFVLIPGLNINLQPEVMWPNTPWIKCEVSAEQVDIRSMDGRSPPFISHDHSFHFQAMFEDTVINLTAEVPRLRWRVIMSSEEASEWVTKTISLSVEQLEQADYPRLICEMGETTNEVDVFLIGKHGFIQPPQGQRSVVSQKNNIWAFDLRMVRDQVRQSGLAEEFGIWVKGSDGVQLYNGTIFAVRPYWDLYNFRVEMKNKNKDEENILHVEWRERGNTIAGRWLVLFPLWRPLEGAIQTHQLREEERMAFDYHLSDIRPGRYVVRAVHAPWGCENWIEAKYVAQQIIDVAKGSWQETFNVQTSFESVEMYSEYLLAHWYRPELVKLPPPTPIKISSEQIKLFLEMLYMVDGIVHVHIPTDGSGSLNIFCYNALATSQALDSIIEIHNIWRRVLPPMDVVGMQINQYDREFVFKIAFQYDRLHDNRAIRSIRQKCKLRRLSCPLQGWHRNLARTKPPADAVIFLCEKFDIFANRMTVEKREYEKLKSIYQRREAV